MEKSLLEKVPIIIGKQDQKGFIRNSKGEVIGKVIDPNNVYDKEGNIIGRVDAKGNVIDKSGANLGKIDASGFIKNAQGEVIGFRADSNNVVDDEGKIIGRLQEDGRVIDDKGRVIAQKDDNNNIVDEKGNIVGILDDRNAVRDNDGKIIAHVQPDNKVVDFNGKVIGIKDAAGRIIDKLGNVLGKLLPDGKVFDEKGNFVGYVQSDGLVKDANGKIIGKVSEDGTVINANNNLIGGVGLDWYEKAKTIERKQINEDIPSIGVISPKGKENIAGGEYKKSLNIALTPDGEYLGDILDNGDVVNKSGKVIGKKMPDGLVIDKDGTLIGIEEIKKAADGDIFVPAGTFGQGAAYGVGSGAGTNLGPGGGYGPGERYNAQRRMALGVAQSQRRQNMQVGKISTNIRKEAFDGMQKKWDNEEQVISSWRVDMSTMILADKPIPAVLARSIDSRYPTPVTAFVERNVYAEEGRNILIPAGSRLIGVFGQITETTEESSESAKVQINWSRLIRPDGSMFKFSGITGDAQGRGGALGYVDKQLFKRYTMPVMTTVLTSSLAYMMATDEENNGETESSKQEAANDARQNFLDQMNQMFEQILQDKSSIQAMSYVPAGTRIIVFPNVDLWLRTVENDQEASSGGGTAKNILIDEDARRREEALAKNRETSSSSSTATSGGNVSYQENGPKSPPLIAEDKKTTTQTPVRPVALPPPPPSSYNSAGTGSGSQTTGQNMSNSNTQKDNSVPQLF